jgi:hypothetical protein
VPHVAKAQERGTLPNLIVIGAMKCGTSSLHRYLDLHPEIAMSTLKEPNFFLEPGSSFSNWERGLDWYTSLFDADAPVRGEASVNYTSRPFTDGVAERMAATLPDARLIYMVRDPIERAVSHYLHARAAGREKRPIEVVLADLDSRYVRRGRYAWQLEPFLDAFGGDRIHIDSQERLLANREETLRRVFAFLGVDDSFTSPQFERMWEVTAGKTRKFTIAYRLSRRLGGADRWGSLPPRLRWLGERLAYHPTGGGVPRPAISEELRSRLRELYAPEVVRLRELSGLRLEGWSA